ncbi:MAG: putative rane protein [Gammaproteobacteria bacterium]|jgi:hypothetical protein|nr:putative rane protein [Gammaproteobacteria bacterium]
MRKRKQWYLYFLALLFFIQTAYADAGLPMIILVMPSMVVLLVPIILIEACVLAKYLCLNFSKVLMGASIGNIVSTIFGIPLTWGVMTGLEFLITSGGRAYGDEVWWQKLIAVTIQAPWMVPYEEQFYWMVPAALAFLMIPFFFISWAIEGFFVKITIDKSIRQNAYRASFYANLASYAFLELCILVYLLINIIKHP